jgi:hypothetical protein
MWTVAQRNDFLDELPLMCQIYNGGLLVGLFVLLDIRGKIAHVPFFLNLADIIRDGRYKTARF